MFFKIILASFVYDPNSFFKKFRKLSSPSQNFFQLQPPPVRCLPETPEQLEEIRAWGT